MSFSESFDLAFITFFLHAWPLINIYQDGEIQSTSPTVFTHNHLYAISNQLQQPATTTIYKKQPLRIITIRNQNDQIQIYKFIYFILYISTNYMKQEET